MSDEQESELRRSMNELRARLAQAQATAQALPPLHQAAAWGVCASCGVNQTRICKRIEGREILICGACALKEMDAWEDSHKA